MAAILGGRPRDDDGIDPPLAQDNVQVRAKKATIAMLLDDMLTGCRRQLRVDAPNSICIKIASGGVTFVLPGRLWSVMSCVSSEFRIWKKVRRTDHIFSLRASHLMPVDRARRL